MGDQDQPAALPSEVRRQKQQAFLIELVEKKIRARAHQLYEGRGKVDGFALADWVQAESEVLEKSILAPLYRRSRVKHQDCTEFPSGAALAELAAPDAAAESRT
jgi:hypothetical protein